MNILESFASDNAFAETMEGLGLGFEQAMVFRTRGKGGLIKRDNYKGYERGVIRMRARHKGYDIHTRSEHASHGVGSFCRTHSGHRTCR